MVFWQVSMQAKAAVAQAALMDAIKAKVCQIEKSDDKEEKTKMRQYFCQYHAGAIDTSPT